MKPRRKKDRMLQLAQFTVYVAKELDPVEIMQLMGLNQNEFDSLYGRYYDKIVDDVESASTLQIYAETCVRKKKNIRDLERLKDALESSQWKNAQAYVAAVKTQNEIADSMIQMGQELNLIEKRQQEIMLVGGRDARELDADESEAAALEEIEQAHNIIAAGTGSKRGATLHVIHPHKRRSGDGD
jgi:hypothetical protein